MITTTNPRTGITAPAEISEATDTDVKTATADAAQASRSNELASRQVRRALLEQICSEIELARDQLIQAAVAETGLDGARLTGELARSVFQFHLFADAITEGSYLEASIDHAGDTALGPQPEIRRMLIPLGPVAVFGASNFPFAFSVLGGDVASALAAGCSVVIKAHPSHPLVSQLSFEVLQRATSTLGAPQGTVGIVHGTEAGRTLVRDPAIKAVGFTGSMAAAEALMAEIGQRADPIPFFGELSSLNPLIVTEAAAALRAQAIATELFGSYTGSMGQLCTKPGIAFVPSTPAGDDLVAALVEQTRASDAGALLNSRITASFGEIRQRLQTEGARLLASGSEEGNDDYRVAPVMLETTASDISAALAEECFGPMMVVARYDDLAQVIDAVARIPASLTTTVHAEESEIELVDRLFTELAPHTGRLVYNGYPTGVRVSWGQHHGGPWPATNTQHTSVGVTAIRRWLRPLAWQNSPDSTLPGELRDDYGQIPRRVDGVLVIPG
jgi:NADP-dependent aldehyde dehydrogenase